MAKYRKIDSGAFADIYDLENGTVLKAFRRKSHIHGAVVDWYDHDLLTKAHFVAEARAYESISDQHDLSKYIPKYFGRANPVELLGSDEYVMGCGFIIEFIQGRAVKLCYATSDILEVLNKVVDELSVLLTGVNVGDASYFSPGLRAGFTLIDFALWESADYECYLFDNGTLSGSLKEELLEFCDN